VPLPTRVLQPQPELQLEPGRQLLPVADLAFLPALAQPLEPASLLQQVRPRNLPLPARTVCPSSQTE